jgi:hypothetical protein
MNGIPERGASSKADRALKLHEQGLTRAQIAERLCVKPDSVRGCSIGLSSGGLR